MRVGEIKIIRSVTYFLCRKPSEHSCTTCQVVFHLLVSHYQYDQLQPETTLKFSLSYCHGEKSSAEKTARID